MPSHLSFDHLVDFADGHLSQPERQTADAHVAGCARCATTLATLQHTLELMRTDAAEEPPAAVVARTVHLFRTRTPVPAAQPSLKKRLAAALGFDSAQQPLAYGMRAGQAGPRQLVFSAEGRHIDLRVTPLGDTWVVAGQVLGDCAGGEAKLEGLAGTVRAALNEMCEFTVPGVSAGTYTLTIGLADVDLEITDLVVS